MGKYPRNNKRNNRRGKNGVGRPKGTLITAHLTLRLTPALKDDLTRIAADEERSLAQLIRLLLREGVEARKKPAKKKK